MPTSKDPPKAQGSTGSSSPAPRPQVAQWEAQIKDLTQKLQQMTDIAGRAQADLQNAKIRMQKDGEDLKKFAAEAVIRKLLPVIDHFQRAFLHLPDDLKNHEWVKGITAIEHDLLRQFGEMGLKKMETLGKPVDTAVHEVVTIAPGKEGEIVEVIEDGYELNGKVLRPAKVIVGDGSK